MHQRTKSHSNQSMDYKDNGKGGYIEECIKGRNGTAIKAWTTQIIEKGITLKNASEDEMGGTVIKAWTTKLIETEITLKNASKDEMAQQSRHGQQR